MPASLILDSRLLSVNVNAHPHVYYCILPWLLQFQPVLQVDPEQNGGRHLTPSRLVDTQHKVRKVRTHKLFHSSRTNSAPGAIGLWVISIRSCAVKPRDLLNLNQRLRWCTMKGRVKKAIKHPVKSLLKVRKAPVAAQKHDPSRAPYTRVSIELNHALKSPDISLSSSSFVFISSASRITMASLRASPARQQQTSTAQPKPALKIAALYCSDASNRPEAVSDHPIMAKQDMEVCSRAIH